MSKNFIHKLLQNSISFQMLAFLCLLLRGCLYVSAYLYICKKMNPKANMSLIFWLFVLIQIAALLLLFDECEKYQI